MEQEDMHFGPSSGRLSTLRSKEEAHDYRYFPEPDLVPLAPTEAMIAAARDELPELPAQRRDRYVPEHGLSEEQASPLAFTDGLGDYFESALATGGVEAKPLAVWITGD